MYSVQVYMIPCIYFLKMDTKKSVSIVRTIYYLMVDCQFQLSHPHGTLYLHGFDLALFSLIKLLVSVRESEGVTVQGQMIMLHSRGTASCHCHRPHYTDRLH